jgi:outer membrane protein OmpU
MRKILLATSALVAGSAIAASASAAEAPSVNLFGSLDIQYQGESNDQSNARTNQLGYLNFMNSFMWDINAEADNGLAYGGRVDWRPSNDNLDEIWIDMSGSFGTVVIGNDDGVGDNTVPQGGSVLVGSFGWTGTYLAGSAAQVGNAPFIDGQFSVGGTGDNAKVSYYSPSFGGFSGGISFTPDDNVAGATTNGGTDTDGDGDILDENVTAANGFDNHVELVAAYAGEFGGTSVNVAGSYKMADSADTANEDVRVWEIGTTVGIAGFSLGASYIDYGDSLVAKNSSADAGAGFSLGVAYSFGAAAVSAGYFETWEDQADGTEDTYSNISLDAEYTVAEGLAVYGGLQFAESDDGSNAAAAGSEESTAVIIGTRLSF